jgi:3-hydroxy acid dehydrogenase / malonic semialdehyde reductase
VRFRGDKTAADKVYNGLEPRELLARSFISKFVNFNGHLTLVTAQDIAEEIVWAASRPAHVNIAETLVLPVNQASATLNFRPHARK